MDLTRRELIRRMGIALAGTGMAGGEVPAAIVRATEGRQPFAGVRAVEDAGAPAGRIPLIHTTDLYDPPQDPDDQIDLATVLALEEYDLRGVVLDITEKFLHPRPRGWDIARKPGCESVARMAHLTGEEIPVAQGPHRPLAHPRDTCEDAPDEEQAGIRMILESLEASPDRVTISVTGSPRTLTAAYNREPALLREKTLAVVLNAGSTGGTKVEWNVGLDPQAFIGLWRSGLPIRWYPPATGSGAFNEADGRGTYFRAPQAELFKDLPAALRSYVADALAGSLPEGTRHVPDEDADDRRWQAILAQSRNLWSTASLVMGAGRMLTRTAEGWRFLPAGAVGNDTSWPWRLDPIRASVGEQGRVDWTVVKTDTPWRIFGRRPGPEFGRATTEALNALLRGLKGPRR